MFNVLISCDMCKLNLIQYLLKKNVLLTDKLQIAYLKMAFFSLGSDISLWFLKAFFILPNFHEFFSVTDILFRNIFIFMNK